MAKANADRFQAQDGHKEFRQVVLHQCLSGSVKWSA